MEIKDLFYEILLNSNAANSDVKIVLRLNDGEQDFDIDSIEHDIDNKASIVIGLKESIIVDNDDYESLKSKIDELETLSKELQDKIDTLELTIDLIE